MEKYVTVVSVDDQLLSPIVPPAIEPVVIVASSGTGADRAVELSNMVGLSKPVNGADEQLTHGDELDDSQFVTVLSINHGGDGGSRTGGQQNAPEVVLVYRLPGERLGFGLKFQGGTKSNEKIQRLFIQSCAENSPASRVQASWGHLREGDEILEIDGVDVSRMTRIECVKCLKDSNVAIKLLVRNGEGKVQNFYGETGAGVTGTSGTNTDGKGVGGGGGGGGGGELPERKGAPPPPPPVPPRKLNKRKQVAPEQQNASSATDVGPPAKQGPGTISVVSSTDTFVPPPDAETYSNLFADDISDLISESDDTASTISTVVDKFSICSSLSSEDYTIPSHGGPAGIGQSAELAKVLKPFTLLEQEFNLESKFETTNLFTFKPPPPAAPITATTNVVQLEVPAAEKPHPATISTGGAPVAGEYENVTIMKVDENRNYENVTVPYGPYENVTIQTVQPYENMVLNRAAANRRQSSTESTPLQQPDPNGVYENVELKATVPPRPLPRQGALVEPKKRAPIPVPIPIVVPPPRLKPAKPAQNGGVQQQSSSGSSTAETTPTSTAASTPLGSEYNTIQSWLQEATEVIHECALTENSKEEEISSTEEKAPADAKQSTSTDLPRLIDFLPKVSVPLKVLEDIETIAPPASPVRFEGSVGSEGMHGMEVAGGDGLIGGGRYELPPSESVVRKCIKILSSEDHTYIESSSSDEDEEKLYGRSEDEDDRSSSLSREATTPEQFLSGDGGYSDEDGEKLGPPEIVSGGPSEAYFNFPWTSNLLPPIGEVEEEFSSLEHQHNGPIVIINTAEETVINDTNNNQQRERKKPFDDESAKLPHATVPSTKIVITGGTGHRIEPMSEVNRIVAAVADSEFSKEEKDEMDDVEDERDQVSPVECGDEDDQDAVDSDDSLEVDNNASERSLKKHGTKIPHQTVESDEKVNNTFSPTDKADDVMQVSVETEPNITCQDGNVVPHISGTVHNDSTTNANDLRPEREVDETTPVTIEHSATMEASGEHEVNETGVTVPESGEPIGSELANANQTKTVVNGNDRAVDTDSNIDAICGDVDIVVGDTVESDFEELVKAQVEPLDVEDSSEQIQQIHERIIVGIERAVSDEDAVEDVLLPVGSEQGTESVTTGDVLVDGETEVTVVSDSPVADGTVKETVPVPVTDVQKHEHDVGTREYVAVEEISTEKHPTEQESSHIASSGLAAGTDSTASNHPPTIIIPHPDADKRTAPGSVTSMDSMNNVVTTTTTVTAIASTVHQLVPAPSVTSTVPSTAATNGGKVAPPAFSRLPPDGHEFPPNFTEPSAATTTTTTTGTTVPNGSNSVNGNVAIPNTGPVAAMTIMNGSITAPVLAKSNDKHSSFNDDLPDLPKSHPPPVPRKLSHTPNGDSFRKPPPFPTRSSSIAESMLSRKELPQAYQSLQNVFEQRRRSVDVPDHHHHGKPPPLPQPTGTGRISLVGSNWRKDEKSEKSVRDKIAMFSSAADADGVVPPVPQHTVPITAARKFSKDFTKSSENLLSSSRDHSTAKKPVEAIETYATLRKKAHSVEHLDEVDRAVPMTASTTSETPYKAKFSLETSKPVVLGKAYSVENLNPISRTETVKPLGGMSVDGSKVLARTTSFSGYSNGHSLATIATSSPGSTSSLVAANLANSASGTDERWKSSISNLLEQRKKSMSKLRGLVIPEKVPETEVLPEARIIGLPIIKSKDSEIILSSGVIAKPPPMEPPAAVPLSYSRKTSTLPMPPKSSLSSMTGPAPTVPVRSSNGQDGTFRASTTRLQASIDSKQSESESEMVPTFRKPLPPMPPVKPPRTSLVYPPKSGSTDCLRSTEDESDDSDSVLSSRVSSPPVSPVAPAAPVEKYALTRTLSSETNTSITSSNSTLTSSSGSQASCSSVGSTPTVDISRKLSKSSSSEASMNRKNVLASAKCRNGRGGGDLKIEDVGTFGNGAKSKRYEDGDSTDGYEEEERRKSKSKPRSSLTNGSLSAGGKSIGYEAEKKQELTHYKVVDSVDSIVDKVIKVASYVEVVSDLEDNSVLEEPIVASAIPLPKVEKPLPTVVPEQQQKKIVHDTPNNGGSMTDLAKWVRHEAARTISHKEPETVPIATVIGLRAEKKLSPPNLARPVPTEPSVPVPTVRRELRSSVETKKLNLAEIRKSFESKSANSTVIPTPVKQPPKEHTIAPATPAVPTATSPPKTTHHTNGHDRFSSWDSLASSSSGVSSLQTNSLGLGSVAPNCTGSSQTLQSTPSDYGSFSSLGSSHSLITPQDLQLIIEEADPPLATPEAFVVVLQRETPESSIGITLAGGSDYEAKEITIHKILTNSPADRDGRLKKGDRILSINGLSMRGLTHRESLSVLKTPRPEVVMVITRSKSLVLDTLTKLKRPSMGSLSSLAEKSEIGTEYERKLKIQHKASRSLDLDHMDVASNEAESVFDGTASEDGLLSADDVSKCSSSNATDNASFSTADVPEGCRMVEINKDGAGLGFSIEGGYDSPTGNKPLIIKKIFMGGAAEKSGLLRAGEEIVAINDISIAKMTRIQVWNMMKKLPNGGVRITLK
ncbi:uncharacterized protein LOC125766944 [Anopheles funestus]|uniref:uncharacterized protein LOC125766944 n=1 Tax=Anopheles funestus TaxID=62324 RepID=UPI0020C6637C|nr:uncharacterized protein LOC125766944 [Anopheles funestus]